MNARLRIAACLILCMSAVPVLAACPPAGVPREELAALRATGFEIAQPEARDAMAIALLDCVGDPQPELRDGLAYSALSTWLRGRQLSAATVHALTAGLLAQLRDTRDPGGFRRPFAALLLSEVAHADLIAVLYAGASLKSESAHSTFPWSAGIGPTTNWLP